MFGSDMGEAIAKNGLDKDPYFARIMARVGKELGQSQFNPNKERFEQKSGNHFKDFLEGKNK